MRQRKTGSLMAEPACDPTHGTSTRGMALRRTLEVGLSFTMLAYVLEDRQRSVSHPKQ